jgi:hypothetical protein
MVRKLDAVDLLELWSHLRQAGRVAGVVVSEIPNFDGIWGRSVDLPEAFLADLKLFLNRWDAGPINAGEPTDTGPVDSVSIADNRDWINPLAELDKRAMGS